MFNEVAASLTLSESDDCRHSDVRQASSAFFGPDASDALEPTRNA